MKQPLMVTSARIPPAQAEALYDASLAGSDRTAPLDVCGWPGEDWEDDGPSPYHSAASPKAGKGRVAPH